MLSDAAKRRDYDRQLKQEEAAAAGGRSGGGSAAGGGDADEAPFGAGAAGGLTEMEMPCRSCGRSHAAKVMHDLQA